MRAIAVCATVGIFSWLAGVSTSVGGPPLCIKQESSVASADLAPIQGSAELRGKALRVAARDALKRSAARQGPASAAEVHELANLFGVVVRDQEMSKPDRDATRLSLRNRLLRIGKDLQAQVKRANRAAKRATSRSSVASKNSSRSASLDQAHSAQTQNSRANSQDVAGPGSIQGGAGGGAVADSAQDLIELIQTTIDPDSWDINGGPGTIRFYRPLNVLVIRASDEVHRSVGGVVNGVRQ